MAICLQSVVFAVIFTTSSVALGSGPLPSLTKKGITTVAVRFYGESGCPDCAQFVLATLPDLVSNLDLMQHVDFDAVPFGNSYFASDQCGKGPKWNKSEAECWATHCEQKLVPLERTSTRSGAATIDIGTPVHFQQQQHGVPLMGREGFLALTPIDISAPSSSSSSSTFLPTSSSHAHPLKIGKEAGFPDWCFADTSEVIGQHGPTEALFDVYQSCAEVVKPKPPSRAGSAAGVLAIKDRTVEDDAPGAARKNSGLVSPPAAEELAQAVVSAPVSAPSTWSANVFVFMWCSDGEIGAGKLKPDEILTKCARAAGYQEDDLAACAKEQGHALEVQNAQSTPIHRGVPLVTVNGKAVHPGSVVESICKILKTKIKKKKDLPAVCWSSDREDGNIASVVLV